jgi:hypothetical protein
MSKTPIHVVRYGFIKCCIWENSTRNGSRHVVTLTRLFKNGDSWQESTRFGRDDLLLAAKALNEAHSFIFSRRAQCDSTDE